MFRLNIECSRDIDELHINFSDGTSVITTKPEKIKQEKEILQTNEKSPAHQKVNRKQEKFLDTDNDLSEVSQETVKLPDITIPDRPVKVATELQNLDI